MMISSTGNKKSQAGFSFIEIMAAIVILSTGIVFIYKAFFVSLTHLGHLNNRIVADRLADKRIAEMELLLKSQGVLSLSTGEKSVRVMVQNRQVDFQFETAVRNVAALEGLYQVDLKVFWIEGAKDLEINRTVYISS